MAWVAVGTAAASLIGGAMAGGKASSAAKKQAEDMAAIQRMYDNIKAPTLEEQRLILEQMGYQGDYSPESMEAFGLGPSSMEGVSADQTAMDAQVEALQGMREIGKGGLTESDLAAARQLQRQTDSGDMARRKSVLNQMAQRGTLGSGMELAAQLQNTQDSAQSQADATDKLIQQAQARALEGLARTGSMSEQMRQQSFNEGSQKAQARDAINKFNTNNRQDVSNQNIGDRNQAQIRNLDTQQNINNQNVGLRNQEQVHNKGLLQNNFQNNLQLTNAKAGRASNTAAANYGVGQASAAQTGSLIGGIGNAIGAGIGAYSKQGSVDHDLNAAMGDPENKGIF